MSIGLNLLELENWLRKHARDILDESDELLNAKYQLIYPIGQPVSLGGGNMRWVTCQKILNLIPQIFQKLSKKFKEAVIEFDENNYHHYKDQFPHCRILSDLCEKEFYNFLAEGILEGDSDVFGMITSEEHHQLVKTFLTEPVITQETHDAVLEFLQHDEDKLNKVLLISGYIRRGILQLAFSKRWRVEYGVDLKGKMKMAVPFRAKDVASERTVFGHPDVGIVLTHLSYYYSGLTDEQLMECFEILKTIMGPESIYDEWITSIPTNPTRKVHASITTYKGVNLQDASQRINHLFPVLRKNKEVINFWLNHKVFPRESKQFPEKIVTTAWDLCYERNKQPTCGFSGTNDSCILLPLPISQQDLPELQLTNRKVEEILQRPENNKHKLLNMNASCREILQEMKKDCVQVLIDSGALMLELENERIAHLWLHVDQNLHGVVYFNHKSELYVKIRPSNFTSTNRSVINSGSADIQLELSPFRERLDKCGIYLDDQHTRGTDLKLPNNSKACVTVGSKMKRDKLIQAAMRMRKLGGGHCVSFYLSHEVHSKILNMSTKTGLEITTKDILTWVRKNSVEFEKQGLIHWAMAGKNYAQKILAEDIFHYPNVSNPPNCIGAEKKNFKGMDYQAQLLGKHCLEEEKSGLQEMYGSYQNLQLVTSLVPMWFENGIRALRSKSQEIPAGIQQCIPVFKMIQVAVVERCNEHILGKMHICSNLDEEQEKELEPEHEKVRQIEKPQSAEPMKPCLRESIQNFVNGVLPHSRNSNFIFDLGKIFRYTSFQALVQPNGWSGQVFASEDFINVIEAQFFNSKVDSFLRPITYIVSLEKNKEFHMLLLSPYEANELIAHFRKKMAANNVKLHMFSPRYLKGQDILINNSNLQLSSNGDTCFIDEFEIAPILLASGNFYFKSRKEQKAFASFLGFIPRPWGSCVAKHSASKLGWITIAGFLQPLFRKQMEEIRRQQGCSTDEKEFTSKFYADPTSLVKIILEKRHQITVRETAHVLQILNKCAYVDIDEEEEANKVTHLLRESSFFP